MKRNQSKMDLYKNAIGKCCDPECESGMNLETHHIRPIKYSGVDGYINYIVLCRDCHRSNGNHGDFDLRMETLFRWKFYNEILLIGMTADDYTSTEYKKVLWATVKARTQMPNKHRTGTEQRQAQNEMSNGEKL